MTELSGTIAVVFILYVLAMLGIGVWTSRMTRSPLDFFLADRSLKAWVTAISSTASSESAFAILICQFREYLCNPRRLELPVQGVAH